MFTGSDLIFMEEKNGNLCNFRGDFYNLIKCKFMVFTHLWEVLYGKLELQKPHPFPLQDCYQLHYDNTFSK